MSKLKSSLVTTTKVPRRSVKGGIQIDWWVHQEHFYRDLDQAQWDREFGRGTLPDTNWVLEWEEYNKEQASESRIEAEQTEDQPVVKTSKVSTPTPPNSPPPALPVMSAGAAQSNPIETATPKGVRMPLNEITDRDVSILHRDPHNEVNRAVYNITLHNNGAAFKSSKSQRGKLDQLNSFI